MTLSHPTEAVIDQGALLHNFRCLQQHLAGRSHLVAVVKANAYGHGILPISLTLQRAGTQSFGVAFVEEGSQLREGGIRGRILVMGGMMSDQAEEIVFRRLTPVLFHPDQIGWLSKWVMNLDPPLAIHVKVDTGMGRLGLSPSEIIPFLQQLEKERGLYVEGLMSHLADEDLTESGGTEEQIKLFQRVLNEAQKEGIEIPCRHIANSAAILAMKAAWFDWVRPGISLYGYCSSRSLEGILPLRPVLTLRSRVTHLRKVPKGTSISYGRSFTTHHDSLIAVVPIGYADGYPRRLSNRGTVLVRGKEAPIVGRICMDMLMLDVTDIPNVALTEEVILLGQQGDRSITAMDLAEQATTVPYEILAGLGSRIPRVYKDPDPE